MPAMWNVRASMGTHRQDDSTRSAGWGRLPPASGAECARALRRAGFQVELDGPDHVSVKRDGVMLVRVPLVEKLAPGLLVAILKTVGVSAAAFTAYLGS